MKQVIVVKLDGIYYGIDVKIVQEVVYSYTERSLPEAPNFIEGLAYVRDQLLPIVRTKRLFNSAFFDLYSNKKVLVLSFARMKGDSKGIDTSSVGIVIDDVIGIESYEDTDMVAVPSVYSTSVSHEIAGFIKRRGLEIALLNIANFFLDQDGNFKYQKYVSRANETEQYRITKDDLLAVEKATNGIFPFVALTRKPILTFLSRLAGFDSTTIANILKNNPKFFINNIHSRIKVSTESFFNNAPDMYVMLEYLTAQIKKSSTKINLLVIDSHFSSSANSLVLAMDSIKSGKTQYQITQLLTGILPGDKVQKQFPKDMLSRVTDELLDKYFVVDKKTELYEMKKQYASKVEYVDTDLEAVVALNYQFDLVYAPNFLVRNLEDLEKNIELLEKTTKKGGVLVIGLLEDIEDFAKAFKKYYIKSRLVFLKG